MTSRLRTLELPPSTSQVIVGFGHVIQVLFVGQSKSTPAGDSDYVAQGPHHHKTVQSNPYIHWVEWVWKEQNTPLGTQHKQALETFLWIQALTFSLSCCCCCLLRRIFVRDTFDPSQCTTPPPSLYRYILCYISPLLLVTTNNCRI